MKLLHLIRKTDDALAEETALAHAKGHQVTCVFLQDAVLSPFRLPGNCYLLKEDVEARGNEPSHPVIDFPGLIDLVFESDSVVCW